MVPEKGKIEQMDIEISRPPGWGKRHTQVLISFIALTIAMAMRVNMSLAIVAMTDTDQNSTVKTYDWSKQTQDIILSSFFWGYFAMNIPSGIIAYHFGGKLTITVSLLLNGITSMLLPLMMQLGGWYAACICRTIQGLAQSVMYPSIHTLLGKWAPLNERGTLTAYTYGGSQFGTLIIMPLSGLMAASSIGWPLIFYVCGIVSVAMSIVYGWLGAASPSEHSTISKAEREYINGSTMLTNKQKPLKTPWKSIITSGPVWILMITQAGSLWGYVTLLTEIPTYMKNILNVDIKSNGLISSLPYLAMWIMNFVVSHFFDYMIRSRKLSVVNARKTANTIGMWFSAAALLAFAYVPANNVALAVFFLVLSLALHSGIHVGFSVNLIDIAPNFSGIIMGICNAISNICGILAPLTVGFILTDPYDVTLWRWCYLLAVGILFFTNLAYVIFTTTDVQPWNEPATDYYELPNKDKEADEKDLKK